MVSFTPVYHSTYGFCSSISESSAAREQCRMIVPLFVVPLTTSMQLIREHHFTDWSILPRGCLPQRGTTQTVTWISYHLYYSFLFEFVKNREHWILLVRKEKFDTRNNEKNSSFSSGTNPMSHVWMWSGEERGVHQYLQSGKMKMVD